MRITVCLLMLAATAIWAGDHDAMTGTWQVDASHASKLKISTIAIKESADGVDVAETDAKAKTIHLTCALTGTPCKSKEAGEDVSFWFNGSALVMEELRHNNDIIIKTRFEPSDDGKTLKMSITHLTPAGKEESYDLTRSGT